MDVLDSKVLVLNKGFNPIRITTVRNAFTKVFSETAEIITVEDGAYANYDFSSWAEVSEYHELFEEEVKGKDLDWVATPSMKLIVPRVIRMLTYERMPAYQMKLTRKNIYERDNYTCFIPGTKILMSDYTLKNIEDVACGDKIIDAEGNVQVVEFVNKKEVDENMLEITQRGNGNILSCTKEHKLLSCDKNGLYNKNGIEASCLSKDDNLFNLSLSLTGLNNTINLSDFAQEFDYITETDETIKYYNSNEINKIIDLDYDFGKFIGFFLAEGSLTKGGLVSLHFHINEEEYTNDLFNIIQNKFGIEAVLKLKPETNGRQLHFGSKIIGNYLKGTFYENGEKRFKYNNYNKEFLKGVLYGIISGDGYYQPKFRKCDLGMKTENLINEIYIISNLLNIYPTISKTYQRPDGRKHKHLIYSAYEYNKLIDTLNLNWVKWVEKPYSKSDRNFVDNKIISKINSIEEVSYNGFVYDLQISDSHTYIANFVAVHNCQYCGKKFNPEDLNLDHVTPRAKGGKNTWTNLVCSCIKCNRKKKDDTLKESGMKLLKRPVKPKPSFSFRVAQGAKIYDDWSHFVSVAYWNCELVE